MPRLMSAAVGTLLLVAAPMSASAAPPPHPNGPPPGRSHGLAPTSAPTTPSDSTSQTSTTSSPMSQITHAGPTNPGRPTGIPMSTGQNPIVTFVLRGTVTAFKASVPASSSNPEVDGTISLKVMGSNLDRATLKDTTLTFTVNGATRVVLHDHTAIAQGDRAILMVRSQKYGDLIAQKPSTSSMSPTAIQLVDQGASIP